MYTINQLNEMSEDQLRELAKSMGMKKVDSIPHDDLVYQVLDHQAETEAANAPEPGKRRRERIRQPAAKANGAEVTKDDAVATKSKNKKENKKKKKKEIETKPQEPEVVIEQDTPDVTPPKRKRGRPSAAEKAAREAASKDTQAEEPQQTDIVDENVEAQQNPETENVDSIEQPTRRRGRKPKAKQPEQEQPVLPFDNMENEQPQIPDMPVETEPEDVTEPKQPEPKPETKPDSNKPKSKKGLWIVIGVVALIALVVMLAMPKGEKENVYEEPVVTEIAEDNIEESKDITITANGVSFVMKRVAGGTFQMGATSEQGSDAYDDEKPVHSMTVSTFYMGETEVTQALWKAVMGSNPSHWKGDNLPVENVSWNDCQEFIRKLNSQTGRSFRLPTEAEWEYAARGGNKSNGYKYAGNNVIDDVAWYTQTTNDRRTKQVKTKRPNELGLYDMSGNVWEWCGDWYGDHDSGSQTNPKGPLSGSYCVLRGGSWGSDARRCRVSCRGSLDPGIRSGNGGFRLCLPQ